MMRDLTGSQDYLGFEDFLEHNKGIVFKISSSYCKDPDDRKDLIQEIIIQLWSSWKSFDGSVKLSTWIYRVALNVAISFYRKDSKRKSVTTEWSDYLVDIVADEVQNEKEEQLNQLWQFIADLREIDRVLLILYLEDKSQKEIGEILGLTETNVSTKIARIKEKLRIRFSLTEQ